MYRNQIYYSNRSAAYAASGEFDSALQDAECAIRLNSGWVKGWARKAAALLALKRYSEAKEAYERALDIEPHDSALEKGLEKVWIAFFLFLFLLCCGLSTVFGCGVITALNRSHIIRQCLIR